MKTGNSHPGIGVRRRQPGTLLGKHLGNLRHSNLIRGFLSARIAVSVKTALPLISILQVRLRKISFLHEFQGLCEYKHR